MELHCAPQPVLLLVSFPPFPWQPSSGRSELESEFRRTRHVLSQLSHLPGSSSPGILSTAAARLAAALKLDESEGVRALGETRGTEVRARRVFR